MKDMTFITRTYGLRYISNEQNSEIQFLFSPYVMTKNPPGLGGKTLNNELILIFRKMKKKNPFSLLTGGFKNKFFTFSSRLLEPIFFLPRLKVFDLF